MASIQFIGRKSVIDAVANRGLEVWALFQQKMFITAGDGTQALNEFLLKLEPGGAGPIYTLKVYKGVQPDDITDKTECNGSFNFRLDGSTLTGDNGAIMGRLDRIEEMLNGSDEDDDQDETFTDILMGYLRDPEKLATVIGAFNQLRNPGMTPPMMQGAAINGMDERRESPAFAVGGTLQGDREALAQRLAAAIDKLERADAKIVDHLEKLASLSETKPALFKMLISQLDAL